MSVWFEGEQEIDCEIEQVKRAIANHGEFYAGLTSLMPGLVGVELVEQDGDSLTIKTNEGLMRRTNITKRIEEGRVVVEFDEQYDAGSKVSARSHFSDQFSTSERGVTHRLVITDVEAPGFLGFLYRKLGSSKMGRAFLAANQAYFEEQAD